MHDLSAVSDGSLPVQNKVGIKEEFTMVLSDLTLSENAKLDEVKAALEEKLGSVLPEGSFSVILRSYQGDFRVRSTNKANYSAMILLDPHAKKAAIEKKAQIEAMGFRVSNKGDISAN
jgi:hypothetical protein